MNDIDTAFRDRIKSTRSHLLDVVDGLVDRMTPQAPPPAAAIAVKRRQIANMLELWAFCDRSQCRRSQCCRGEPLNCLRIGMTVLPLEAFEPLIQHQPGRAARQQRNRAAARPSPANFAAQARD